MQKKSGLTWRKFQRDTISNPNLRFIANKMGEDKKHSVFTLYLTLFCEADDNGIVDLDDLEFLSELSMICVEDLYEILEKFVMRGVLVEIEMDDGNKYALKDWLEPYPSGVKPMTNAERQAKFRAKQKEKLSFKNYKKQENENLSELGDLSKEEWDLILNMTLIDMINERADKTEEQTEKQDDPSADCPEVVQIETKRNESVTPTAVTGVTKSNEQKRREEEVEKEKIDTEETEKIEREKQETEKTEKEAEEFFLEKEEKKEGERHTQEDPRQNKQSQTGPEPRSKEDEPNANSSDENSTEQEKLSLQVPQSYKGMNDDTEKREKQPAKKMRPNPEKTRKAYDILMNFFKNNNKMGFVDENAENQACIILALRVAKLENDKNSVEIIASQFASCFRRLIKSGDYFKNMPCTPQMLLKTGNYTKVFHAVSKILHPADMGGTHWAEELDQTLKNDAIREIEKDKKR